MPWGQYTTAVVNVNNQSCASNQKNADPITESALPGGSGWVGALQEALQVALGANAILEPCRLDIEDEREGNRSVRFRGLLRQNQA